MTDWNKVRKDVGLDTEIKEPIKKVDWNKLRSDLELEPLEPTLEQPTEKRGLVDKATYLGSQALAGGELYGCLLYTSPSPRD